jgi:hypothetical protein
MTETPDRHKTVLALLMVGAILFTLVGGLVGIVKRVTVPMETLHATDMNNQPLLDGYTKESRHTPASIIPETGQRVPGFVEKEFSLHRLGN